MFNGTEIQHAIIAISALGVGFMGSAVSLLAQAQASGPEFFSTPVGQVTAGAAIVGGGGYLIWFLLNWVKTVTGDAAAIAKETAKSAVTAAEASRVQSEAAHRQAEVTAELIDAIDQLRTQQAIIVTTLGNNTKMIESIGGIVAECGAVQLLHRQRTSGSTEQKGTLP